MRLITKDILKLSTIFLTWFILRKFCILNNYDNFNEAINYFPIHLIITIGFYAGVSVCLNVINIKNCEKEYSEVLDEINEARKYYMAKNIKYN